MPRTTARPRALALLLAPTATAALAAGLVLAPAPAADAAGITTRALLHRTITAPQVVESSGLARSTYARGVLWTHNDSGGRPTVFAIGGRGTLRATVTLSGAKALDWEDIASGPNHKIWVADVGNNAHRRSVISVYKFAEPRALRNATLPARRIDLRYPDGKHNSEAILVHPTTGRLYVVTKSPGGGAVYRAPKALSRTRVNTLTRIASAPSKVTAGAFTPDGRRVVLCNYGSAWVYGAFGGRGMKIDKPPLRQGESLEVNRRGTAVFMGSEGRRSPIYKVSLP